MKRRLLWISEHASPLATLGGADSGGQNVYVAQVARHLAAAGHRVDVMTRRDRPDLPAVVPIADRLRVVHVPAGPPERVRKEDLLPYMDDFADFAVGYALARRRPYELVHANFFMSGLVASEVRRRVGAPFVVTFHALGRVRRLHQGGADAFPEERLAIEGRVASEADRVLAECPQDEEDLIAHYGADPARLTTVPCGFDPGEFSPTHRREARARLGLPLDAPIVLQLGRMVPRKGVDNVIRALALVRRAHGVPARLVVVGGESRDPDPAFTPEIGRLQAIARAEGVAASVRFVGGRGRDELRDYFGAADVFATTPWYEPFGITPLEAMACGVPVVGSAVGGIKSTVLDGETGFLVPPDDPPALADRLARVLTQPSLRDAMGRRALRHVNARYTWKRVARSIAEVYEEVLSGSRAGRAPALAPASARVPVRPGL
ncbi:glycosyltransferase family 1 protein [Paludisphaera sp.]|uniref:glycosyltransferase family 4 protein n=1 Tax=Paludisphaera sp. TaxID=2017432 RepID=UPI00301DC62C